MCGIAGIHVKKPGVIKSAEGLETFVNLLLLGIEKRGPHSTGFVATTFGESRRTVMDKAPKTATEFIKTRDRIPANPQTILLHTRYATKGAAEDHRNNHPVLHKTCFAVHNGHIHNDDELFEQYTMPRGAEVDSEAIAALAYKVGLDDPAEFLSKFKGYMATAIIDPVNFPGKLVLAKGIWSPIVSFENDRFLVFASEMSAIKEAWAAVIGTPPKYDKFRHWKEGEYSVWDDAVRTEATFQVTPYSKQRTSSYTGTGYGAPPPEEKAESKTVTTPAIKATTDNMTDDEKRTLAVRAIVRAARAQSSDWIECVPMNAMNDATRKELAEKYPEMGGIRWHTCFSCDTFIIAPQFVKTLNWGNICLDCQKANVMYYQRKAEKAEAEPEKVEWIDPETTTKLLEFLGDELDLHTEALANVAEETNTDIAIVDWLIFRAPDSYFDKYPLLGDVAGEFDNMYQEYMESLWEAQKEAAEAKERMLDYCSEHGQYRPKDSKCPDCALDAQWAAHSERERAERAFPTVGGYGMASAQAPATDMNRCDCGRYSVSNMCIICRNKEQAQAAPPARLALTAGKPVELCITCGGGAEFIAPRKGWGWCVDCFVECGMPTEGVPCTGLCNHTTPDGTRTCHRHARGIAGVESDSIFKNRNGDFVELGRY